MAEDIEVGDRVSWNTAQGRTHGKVVKRLTSDTHVQDHPVKASQDEPQFLVESEKTGARAAHKPEALTKLSRS
ncbi:MAG: hypothetical protein ACI8U3_001875 [Brevundimonas sp.]|jgi:hypothetical protein|uniref:DUF2945 domain-containing protein n=1 Tax=Brevundimonas sp. TaxID=1871086 RepID=UPI0039E6B344